MMRARQRFVFFVLTSPELNEAISPYYPKRFAALDILETLAQGRDTAAEIIVIDNP